MKTAAAFVLAVPILAAQAVAAPAFRAGAAKIDITPPLETPLPMAGYPGREDGQKSIHDHLFVRAIAMDDGSQRAAIVTADLIGFSTAFATRAAERIARESGIPRENLLLAGTHTHGGPALGNAAYASRVEDALAAAATQAFAALQPARAGYGAGRANLNINRRALFFDGSWWLGFNPDGPSDKTAGVVKFVDQAGEPIAILVNYGVHGTSMGMENQAITADNPGATSTYIERHFQDRAVALFTSGAAGDQAPIYDRAPKDFSGVLNMGRVLGDEVIRIADTIKPSAAIRLRGAQRVVSCPGRKLASGRVSRAPAENFTFADAAPVEIRLSLLMVGDIALAGVSGEIFSVIGQEMKQASAAPAAMMITHCNGSSGYIPDDAAYDRVSYEIQVTRVKPGCAEKSIASNLAEMIRALR